MLQDHQSTINLSPQCYCPDNVDMEFFVDVGFCVDVEFWVNIKFCMDVKFCVDISPV